MTPFKKKERSTVKNSIQLYLDFYFWVDQRMKGEKEGRKEGRNEGQKQDPGVFPLKSESSPLHTSVYWGCVFSSDKTPSLGYV